MDKFTLIIIAILGFACALIANERFSGFWEPSGTFPSVSQSSIGKKTIEYRVSEVGRPGVSENRENLIRLFNNLQMNYGVTDDGIIVRRSGETYQGFLSKRMKIIMNGKSRNSYYVREPREFQWYYVQGAPAGLVADEVYYMRLRDTGRLTTFGSRSLRVYEYIHLNTLEREQFVEALREGKTFWLTVQEIHRCDQCRGTGRLSSDRMGHHRNCPSCIRSDKGNRVYDVTYKVVW